jgi:hypothetical protein
VLPFGCAAGGLNEPLPGGPGKLNGPEFCASAAVLGGLKRSAAFGTSKTSSRAAVTISAVAVIPGRKLESSLLTLNTVEYETTLSLVCEP